MSNARADVDELREVVLGLCLLLSVLLCVFLIFRRGSVDDWSTHSASSEFIKNSHSSLDELFFLLFSISHFSFY